MTGFLPSCPLPASRYEHVVLGHARDETLVESARCMDDAFALLDGLVPLAGSRTRRATVAILVDEKYVHSPGWGELLMIQCQLCFCNFGPP